MGSDDVDPLSEIKRCLKEYWDSFKKLTKTEDRERKKRAEEDLRKVYQEQYDLTYMEERSKFLMEKAKRDAEKKAKKDTTLTGTIKEMLGL